MFNFLKITNLLKKNQSKKDNMLEAIGLTFLKRAKAVYLGQVAEQKPQIKKICLNSKKNSYS